MIYVYIGIGIIAGFLILALMGRRSGSPNTTPALSDEDIADLVKRGRKLEAIKAYRLKYGVGLAEAKQAVEAMTVQ